MVKKYIFYFRAPEYKFILIIPYPFIFSSDILFNNFYNILLNNFNIYFLLTEIKMLKLKKRVVQMPT